MPKGTQRWCYTITALAAAIDDINVSRTFPRLVDVIEAGSAAVG